jgi:hypothetical protein
MYNYIKNQSPKDDGVKNQFDQFSYDGALESSLSNKKHSFLK